MPKITISTLEGKMKILIVFFIAVLSSIQVYASDKGPGCGVGKVVFEGKKGLGSHLGASSVNGTVGYTVPSHQSFAMSSGVLGCDTDQTVKTELKQTFFISNNVNDLMNDISKGEGDYLFAYGELLGCSGDLEYFSKHLKVNFNLVIQDGTIAKNILLNTKRVLNDSNHLKKICIPAA